MKKLRCLIYLRNFLYYYPRSSYCTYVRPHSKVNAHWLRNRTLLQRRLNSNLSSLPNEGTELKRLLEEFPEPKKILWRIINETYGAHGNSNVKPSVTAKQIENETNMQLKWQVSITLEWPEKFEVVGVSNKKSDAETLCYLNACLKMKNFGLLDQDNKPAFLSKAKTFDDETIKLSKSVLGNLYQRIWTRHGKKEYIPRFHTFKHEGIFGKESYWKSQLNINYPETKVFEGYSSRLRVAECIAAAKALQWLRENGTIDSKGRLVQYSNEEEERFLKLHHAPYSISIPEDLQSKMTSILEKVEKLHEHVSANEILESDENKIKLQGDNIYDVITENLYHEPSAEETMKRSKEMFYRNVSFLENKEPTLREIKEARLQLPIADKRIDILRMLDENQIVVLSGETGCGKTTQVPQYILDYYIEKMKGAACNIVVTQPRRISAISIAERVAQERGEKVGETIGHHVRLNKNLPQQKGAILYCSTGMLLRKLCSNPELDGISHIIVDEVHERNIQIDFLLILLKRLLANKQNIKLVLMSASFNTNIFSQYFNNCPVIHVPGKIYPVKEFFLEDLKADIPNIRSPNGPVLDADLVVNVINHINKTQKPGAILCFLPGWHDILTVKNKLLETDKEASKLMICCAHSRLPHEEQKTIFEKARDGKRKVILATNIAETSITIDDVVFVVNSGLHKGTSFDGERGVASLGTQWITKANVRQRRGRAGRVQPGVCYNLFTWRVLMAMDDYPVPELLRIPLENVILDCKLYCPESKAEDFLSMALQPPGRPALQAGVMELQVSGVLDESENLTDLGKIIVNFATHPRLSVSLVYAAFLGCLDPVLTICAILTTGKEPFINTLEEKSVIKKIKRDYDNYLCSDHIALNKVFDTWNKLNEDTDVKKFIEENLLDEQNLNFIKELKSLFAADLHTYGIIDSPYSFSDPENKCNINSNHMPSIFAALTAAFYPNVIKLMQGEIAHGRINKDAIIYSLLKGQRGYIQKESVVSNETELPSPWLIYFSALQSEARRLMMTSAVSSVPGICLLLFAGQNITMSKANSHEDSSGDSVILTLDDHKKLTFNCTQKEADIILKWRDHVKKAFQVYIQSLENQPGNGQTEVSLYGSDFLPVVKEVLSTPQVPFTKGHVYKFVNNYLVSEDL